MKIDELIAGDTLDFVDEVPEYPATDGWTLKYRLIPRFTDPVQAPVDIVATTYLTTQYRIQETAPVTATWAPGDYTWARWVEQSSGQLRQSVGQGQLEVLTDPAQATQGYDSRSHARKMVDRIEAALEALNYGVKSYTVAGRMWLKEDTSELMDLLTMYRAQVEGEKARAAIAAGRPNPRIFKGSFRRVS